MSKRQGPFLHSGKTVESLFFQVTLSLIPLIIFRSIQDLKATLFTLLAVFLASIVLNRYQSVGKPGIFLIGILLAVILPVGFPPIPLFFLVAASVLLGRELHGGLGENPVNPAAFGFILALTLFPDWISPSLGINLDGLSGATPLLKNYQPSFPNPVYFGKGGFYEPLLLILGGGTLLFRGVISWRIPLFYFLGVVVFTLILPGGTTSGFHLPHHWDPFFQLLSGGTLLTGFYLLTDPVTSPQIPKATLFYPLIAALITVWIRKFTPYPDGCAFAVILSNLCTPLLDHFFLLKGKELPSKNTLYSKAKKQPFGIL